MADKHGDENSDAESKNSSSDSSSDSDAMSSCGLQSDEESGGKVPKKAAAKALSSQPKKEEPAREQRSSEPPAKRHRGKGPDQSAAVKATERIDNQLNSADKVLLSLTELTADSLWRSMIRTNELDRRMGRATSAKAEVQKVMTHAAATEQQKTRAEKLHSDIEVAANIAAAMKEVNRLIRGSQPLDLAKQLKSGEESDLYKSLQGCAVQLMKELSVVIDIITTIAKKLVDVAGDEAGAASLVWWIFHGFPVSQFFYFSFLFNFRQTSELPTCK